MKFSEYYQKLNEEVIDTEDVKENLSESLIDPGLFIAIASMGTAIFTILNAETVANLVMKYGKKVISVLEELEEKKALAKKIKDREDDYNEMIEVTRRRLLKSGLTAKEAQLVIDSTFGEE